MEVRLIDIAQANPILKIYQIKHLWALIVQILCVSQCSRTLVRRKTPDVPPENLVTRSYYRTTGLLDSERDTAFRTPRSSSRMLFMKKPAPAWEVTQRTLPMVDSSKLIMHCFLRTDKLVGNGLAHLISCQPRQVQNTKNLCVYRIHGRQTHLLLPKSVMEEAPISSTEVFTLWIVCSDWGELDVNEMWRASGLFYSNWGRVNSSD